jgi:hypothetical protein
LKERFAERRQIALRVTLSNEHGQVRDRAGEAAIAA